MSKSQEVSDLFTYVNSLYEADVLSKGQWSRLSEKINAALTGKSYGPIVITKVKQTCHGCPSAWEAWDKDGKEYNLRYRYGVGVLRYVQGDVLGRMIAKFTYGDDMAGICTLEEFVDRIGGYLELSENLQHVD